jgi:hypothetical protein
LFPDLPSLSLQVGVRGACNHGQLEAALAPPFFLLPRLLPLLPVRAPPRSAGAALLGDPSPSTADRALQRPRRRRSLPGFAAPEVIKRSASTSLPSLLWTGVGVGSSGSPHRGSSAHHLVVLGASDVKLGNAGEYFRSGWSRFVGLIEALRYLRLLRDFTPKLALLLFLHCVSGCPLSVVVSSKRRGGWAPILISHSLFAFPVSFQTCTVFVSSSDYWCLFLLLLACVILRITLFVSVAFFFYPLYLIGDVINLSSGVVLVRYVRAVEMVSARLPFLFICFISCFGSVPFLDFELLNGVRLVLLGASMYCKLPYCISVWVTSSWRSKLASQGLVYSFLYLSFIDKGAVQCHIAILVPKLLTEMFVLRKAPLHHCINSLSWRKCLYFVKQH